MKCRLCDSTAIAALPRHNSGFCRTHFIEFFQKQVRKAIRKYAMFSRKDRLLVCVSGGKDSLTLWHVLNESGYDTTGLYIDLGIGGYSRASLEKAESFAESIKRELIVVDFAREYADIKRLATLSNRTDCSTCGVVKRYFFNRVALEQGFDVVATGHNLDDEAARLLGNILRWQIDLVRKQSPLLDSDEGLVKKVKPLFRLTEQEIAIYAFLNRIDYLREECPMSRGTTGLIYKDILNRIELESPGTKHFFYFQFLERRDDLFSDGAVERKDRPSLCRRCGMPCSEQVCAFCRLTDYLKRSGQTPDEPA